MERETKRSAQPVECAHTQKASDTETTPDKYGLSCVDTSRDCVEKLTAQAMKNSESAQVLEQAIKLKKTTLWTDYISTQFFNLPAAGLLVTQNIAGGGNIANSKLTVAQLKVQKIQLEEQTRLGIMQHLTEYVTAHAAVVTTQTKLDELTKQLELFEVSYARGDSDTMSFLTMKQQARDLTAQIEQNRRAETTALALLREIVAPSRLPVPVLPKKKG